MKKQTLTFLGRDSGFGEKNNSAYIELEDKLILIDCGFTVFEQVKNRFDLSKYKEIKIIVTHLHNDHAGSLSQLVLYAYFVKNKKVTVLSKCERIKEYLEITGTPEDAYELKDDIEFIKTEHVKYLDAYGFCLNILKFLKLLRTPRKNSCWSIKINYLYPKELAIVSHQPLTTKISW